MACSERQGRTGFSAPRDADLRRYFRQQMMRIQADSVYHACPVFRTLQRTSDLADSIVAAAYDVALEDALATAPPADPRYKPAKQMMVIALGRLGMREFDLASDADLNFVIPDERCPGDAFLDDGGGANHQRDQRLHRRRRGLHDRYAAAPQRPRRRAGPDGGRVPEILRAQRAGVGRHLVHEGARDCGRHRERAPRSSESCRRSTGNATGRRGVRAKNSPTCGSVSEREQGVRNPLKAGTGGYYDIDFVLMYLRLRDAGSFYKALNTPKRIEVIVRCGRSRAPPMRLFSAMPPQCFVRLITACASPRGTPKAGLPTNPAQIAVLTELVHRWVPPALAAGDRGVRDRSESAARRAAFSSRIFASE